jgi:hypothetical protein
MMARPRLAATAAVLVALVAFLLYRSTLLPGLDFGDTPSFQVMGGDPAITPRDAYPLYFAAGAPFVWLTGDRAHGMNLASAVEGAIACGLVVLVAVEISGAVLPAGAAALLFAGSYTFWSQAVIAEVYALHACMMALSLLLLLRWERRPTTGRLAAFFLAYAIGFGNHLAMVLLLPGYAAFLLIAGPRRWRSVLTPRVVCLAIALAIAGALQYTWNLHSLWLAPVPPHSLTEALGKFWFDVTKADWRETMVANVPTMMASERLRMYAFDVRQQFGLVGPFLAAAGFAHLVRTAPHRALLFALLFAVNAGFALTYSVGDSHVFFLPSHLVLALLCAPGLALIGSVVSSSTGLAAGLAGAMAREAAAITVIAIAVATAYTNYPALDRSQDTRPADLVATLTAGLDDQHDLLLTDLNWQEQNGLNYFTTATRLDVAVASLPQVLPYAPRLIADNLAIGRTVVTTDTARRDLAAAYPGRFAFAPDSRATISSLAALASGLPPGTRYVLSILKPPRGLSLDRSDVTVALDILGANSAVAIVGRDDFAVIVGETGRPPALVRSSPDPFRERVDVEDVGVDVRMESWPAFDTIRRMGFGQVIAARHHTLIVERGVSFVAFDDRGRALRQGYASSLFAPEQRWTIVVP